VSISSLHHLKCVFTRQVLQQRSSSIEWAGVDTDVGIMGKFAAVPVENVRPGFYFI